jgi:hypothetical protein
MRENVVTHRSLKFPQDGGALRRHFALARMPENDMDAAARHSRMAGLVQSHTAAAILTVTRLEVHES